MSPGSSDAQRGAVNVLLVEDHPLMRETVAEAIGRMEGFTVCQTSGTGEEALEQLESVSPDIVLLDMALPGMTGTELVSRVMSVLPEASCVVLSGHREAHYVNRAVAAGARGYILKGNPYAILEGIRSVADGNTYFSPELQLA